MKPPGWMPGARSLASYRRSWLRHDLVAGLVLSTLLVPQGMAYAELAGLPAITGLYTTVLCLIGYAAFGPSRVLVLGPDSSLGPMIAATLLPIIGSGGDPDRAIALASMLALLVGAIEIGAGAGEARVHRGPAVQADADRLHEWARADDPGRAAAEALRLLDRRGRTHRRGAGVRQRACVGRRRGRRRCRGGGQPRADPAPPALAAPHPRRAGRGRRRDRRDRGARPLRPRGLARRDPARGAALPHLAEPGVRSPAPGCGSPRHRAGVPDRHDLHRFGVRGANAAGGRRQQGDDRHRRGERRGGLVPGLPGQHERLAHGRGRAGRREDPAHRAGRRSGDRPDAGARAGAAAQPPAGHSRGRRDRRLPVAGRHRGDQAAVAPAARRVPALDGRLPRRGTARSARRHRRRRGAVDPQRVPPGLVALPDHPRACPRDGGPSRPQPLPRCGGAPRPRDLPLRRAPALRERADVPRPDPPPRGRRAEAALDRRSRPSRSRTSTPRLPTCSSSSTRRSTRPAPPLSSRSSRTPFGPSSSATSCIGTLDPDHFFRTLDGALEAFRRQTGAEWTAPAKGSDRDAQ